jgi:glutamate-1-semialdehyde 2,1-aminomutase
MVTGGKGIAGGIPIGAYGMTDELAALVADNIEDDTRPEPGTPSAAPCSRTPCR